MKSKRINELAFFAKPADCLAKELIGMNIHLNNDAGNKISFKITETEAYFGEETFCYGHSGKKPQRKSNMFYSVGKICYYYGMLMISCGSEETSDNVLIRGLNGIKGPVNCANALGITYRHNSEYLFSSKIISLEYGEKGSEYIAAPRKGIPDKKPLNFKLK